MFNQRGNILSIIGVIVLLIVIGAVGYYLGLQKNSQLKIEDVSKTVASPVAELATIPSSPSRAATASIPSDWTLKSSSYCNFKFYLPPNKAPYFELLDPSSSDPINRRFWQVRDFSDPKSGQSAVTIMHVADTEASGFISGQVSVSCRKNTDSKTADQALKDYADDMTDPVLGTGLKGQRVESLWGQQVSVGTFDSAVNAGFDNYFFANKDYVYIISKQSASQDSQVKNTTDLIFNNLQFPN